MLSRSTECAASFCDFDCALLSRDNNVGELEEHPGQRVSKTVVLVHRDQFRGQITIRKLLRHRRTAVNCVSEIAEGTHRLTDDVRAFQVFGIHFFATLYLLDCLAKCHEWIQDQSSQSEESHDDNDATDDQRDQQISQEFLLNPAQDRFARPCQDNSTHNGLFFPEYYRNYMGHGFQIESRLAGFDHGAQGLWRCRYDRFCVMGCDQFAIDSECRCRLKIFFRRRLNCSQACRQCIGFLETDRTGGVLGQQCTNDVRF